MINPDVELFLAVTSSAFRRARDSKDPHQMYSVIRNARIVIENYENMAFMASVETLGEETK